MFWCVFLLVLRTSTVWKSLNPFFGEEFFVDLAPDFQEVSVQVFDQDLLKADDPIGKVTFSRKQIASSVSGWLGNSRAQGSQAWTRGILL